MKQSARIKCTFQEASSGCKMKDGLQKARTEARKVGAETVAAAQGENDDSLALDDSTGNGEKPTDGRVT